MKRLLPLLLLLLIPLPAEQYDPFDQTVIDFTTTFNSWLLEYRGCTQHPTTDQFGVPQNCLSGQNFNLKTWKKAGKLAWKLWPEP